MIDIEFDLRSNPSEKRGDDVDQPTNTKDLLHIPKGLITRSKAKALNGLIVYVSAKAELMDPFEHQEEVLEHLIHVQEGSYPPLFGP